jgi:hypothetical protein
MSEEKPMCKLDGNGVTAALGAPPVIHFCNNTELLLVDDLAAACPNLQIGSIPILHDGLTVRDIAHVLDDTVSRHRFLP